jgi:mRNA interferase MazF
MIARGEIWTVAGGGFAGKPRPAVIIQNDLFVLRGSATICLLISVADEFPLFRIRIEPVASNGLADVSFCMADKLTTVRNDQLGKRIGRLSSEDMLSLDQAIMLYLDLGRV